MKRVPAPKPCPALLLATALGLVVTAGCDGKSEEKCSEALTVTRQALAAQDFAAARQWREYAHKVCPEAPSTIDQEVVAAEAAAQQAKAQAEQVAAESAQLLSLFKQFVATNRAAIDKASSSTLCEEPQKATRPTERFCSGTRAAGKFTLGFRYWDADKNAVSFSVTPSSPVSCEELGPHSVVAAWQVPALDGRSVPRAHCSFTGGELAGLSALVSSAQNAPLQVFSPAYEALDAGLRARLSPR